MNKEKEQFSTFCDELLDTEKSLVLYNDDVNTFDHVIDSLVEVCNHTYEQAETCAIIVHYKGKTSVKSGSFDELLPYKQALLDRHLTVKIQ